MKLKRFTAGVLACALLIGGAAGCTVGGDNSWCAKTSSTTLPAGVYIYELYSAYNEAQSKTTGTSDMKKAKIDNQAAMTWVNNRAKVLTNELFLLNDKMKAMKLSFSSTENAGIKQMADNAWAQQFSSALKGKNVSEDSFKIAYAEYTYQLRKVLQGIYDTGGSKAIPESEMKAYFEKHYSDVDFTYVPLTKGGSSSAANGTSSAAGTAMTAQEKATLKKELEGYLSQIQSGKMTVQAASAAYAKAHGATDNYQNVTEDMNASTVTSSMPPDLIQAIKSMKAGESRLLEVSSYYYVLVTKNDITKKTASFLKNQDDRFKLLYAQKGDQFLKDLETEAKSYKGVDWNERVTRKFTSDLFYTAPSSSAGPSSAASSKVTASASSSTVSSAKASQSSAVSSRTSSK